MPQDVFDYLTDEMGDPRDPQVQAETENEWLVLGCPDTLEALMRQLEAAGCPTFDSINAPF